MTIHLYQRTLTRNGQKIKAWYYWYYDDFGKQIRKSCGKDGKPCILKRDAEACISNLKEEELKKEKITFADYCMGFYEQGSRFLRKQEARGYKYQPNSVYQKKLYLQKFLTVFGKVNVRNLTAGMVENWLIDMDCSNSVKNNILATIDEIEGEIYSDGLIDNPIHVKHFKRNTHDKGILSLTEISKLFPADYDKLLDVWRIRSTEREKDIYSFAAAIYTLLTTGMRSSEIRALQWNQFIRPDAILINAMIDSNSQRVNRLKKWTAENKKWRVTVLPDRTVRMIDLLRLDKSADDYVFVYMNKPLTTWFLLDHFKCVLQKNGIEWKERNITIHSLRFTYNSLMKGEISGEDLRLMVGHTTEAMTEYYDKSRAIEHLDTLLLNKDSLNSVFN
ncbi:MAG: tyrosine-type recombinase/integrase [Treponema sp.]|nr:tyrosine-type recombinase/integrase [Treponema sp.]